MYYLSYISISIIIISYLKLFNLNTVKILLNLDSSKSNKNDLLYLELRFAYR
nr:MAG TPA: hypothetical protein [Bacteriophage sp.]DAT46477.1 MAG TPA: hypothetical protein [Caudoviricetes sp.]